MAVLTRLRLVEPEPWERRPGEHPLAYAAFSAWRDAAPTARTHAIAQAVHGVSRATVTQWMRDHDWEDRAREWDREQEAARMRVQQDLNEKLLKRHAQTANAFISVLSRPAVELAKRITDGRLDLTTMENADLYALTLKSAAALGKLVDIERLSNNLPSTIAALSGPDGGPVQVNFAAAVKDLFTLEQQRQQLEGVVLGADADGAEDVSDCGCATPGNAAEGCGKDLDSGATVLICPCDCHTEKR